MKADDLYKSKSDSLKAADLANKEHRLRIGSVETVSFDEGTKLLVRFQGKQKGLVLNKTNYAVIAAQFGNETDHWINKEIIIYPTVTEMKGQGQVPCIRVRPAVQAATPDDDIPW